MWDTFSNRYHHIFYYVVLLYSEDRGLSKREGESRWYDQIRKGSMQESLRKRIRISCKIRERIQSGTYLTCQNQIKSISQPIWSFTFFFMLLIIIWPDFLKSLSKNSRCIVLFERTLFSTIEIEMSTQKFDISS